MDQSAKGMMFLFLWISFAAFPCTDFVVKSADGALLNARSMEFALDLQSTIQVFPRKMERESKAPGNASGIRWISKYGYLGVTAFGMDIAVDGMNEKGLTYGALWLPGTEYETAIGDEREKALDFIELGNWVLGNFAAVAEVKEALKGIRVWGHPLPPISGIPPLHMAIHDANGNHLVIEFIKGEMRVYDNPNTVLTNSPTFDWMLGNLQNYIQLSAQNISPIKLPSGEIGQTGQGSGMLGLPGDYTPPSRFVRMTTFLRFVKPAPNAVAAAGMAEHLLNTVDIPLGVIRERSKIGSAEEYTQWSVIKDQTNLVFYFRSYKDLALKSVDMKRINFNPGSKGSIAIDLTKGYFDATGAFKKSS